jgi:ABC-type multidrug transport system fused ATPase/permease subunit
VHARSAIILLCCVPLIPMSIVAVQKFAKKLLAKYWGEYTTLGDSFLENIQGLTTLKIYQADGWKHEQMNAQAERFRKFYCNLIPDFGILLFCFFCSCIQSLYHRFRHTCHIHFFFHVLSCFHINTLLLVLVASNLCLIKNRVKTKL